MTRSGFWKMLGLSVLGVGTLVGIGLAADRRSRRTPLQPAIGLGRALSDNEDIKDQIPSSTMRVIEPEVDDAIERARAAGARGKLTFIGAGMTGIVFCDEHGNAYKVGRHGESLGEEATWMTLAAKMPGIGPHIAKRVSYNKTNHVLVRECVHGKTGTWGQSGKLHDLHKRIEKEMLPYGWTSPEFKEDSYINVRGRGPVLVDASMAHRVGKALVSDTLDALNNRRKLGKYERWSDLAFALRMERGGTVPAPVADKLLARLKEKDPSIET